MTEDRFLLTIIGQLLAAAPVTLLILLVSAVLATLLAGVLTACAASGSRVLRLLSAGWTFLFRGTPLILQIFMVYYGLAMLPWIRQGPLWFAFRNPIFCSCLAMTCCCSAYIGEVFRGAMKAVPIGGIEAGRACGMSRFQLLRRVIMPALTRIALPSYSNEVIMMVKSTSLASTVTVMDITGVAQGIISKTYRTLEVFLCAAALYLLLNAVLTAAFGLWARRLHIARRTSAR
jgi:octopine/nopaline transport system permease protein